MTNEEQNQTNEQSTDAIDQVESILPIADVEEEIHDGEKKVRHKGVYLLPNLFTTGAMFAGFYAIIAGMQGRYFEAVIAIIFAGVCDGLDGRVARMTNTQSAFGVQYDSLSDLISFGVAPALLVFNWSLHELGKFGWVVAFIYMACAAIRLARFNTQVDEVDSKYFIGLASPAAAGVIVTMVWNFYDLDLGVGGAIPVAIATLITGLMMVTNFKFFSNKAINFGGRVSVLWIIAAVVVLGLIALKPAPILLLMLAVYTISGPLGFVKMVESRNTK